ncbi:hypothetical protein ACH41H_44710 [Streptomyces sp. NPDC020800]|uniref:hypothetical protein n=1 Tax=Streptomyces sp. NPDC020800 TaxID=3365092 RepID=UPI0037A7DF15
MHVTVWHNTGPDHFFGFQPDHPMLRVFSYTAANSDTETELARVVALFNPDANSDTETELWRAVALFNADLDMLAGADREVAAAYRARRLRSFSTGDGFSVRPPDGGAETFWVSDGFDLLRQAGPFPVLGLDAEHGSQPLGSRVTYLVPTLDDLVREGLFEVAGTAEAAIATHHGVAADDVVVLTGPR